MRQKNRNSDEKPPVEVRPKDAEMLDFRRISVVGGLSGRNVGHIGDQVP